MSYYTTVAVLKEYEQELESWLRVYGKLSAYLLNRVVIAECVVLNLVTDQVLYNDFAAMANDRGWAYNMVEFREEIDYWPTRTYYVRFDYQGNRIGTPAKSPGNAEVRQVLHQMITLENNDPRMKDRLFHAYLLCTEWENQYEYGRLHQMRKLIGGE